MRNDGLSLLELLAALAIAALLLQLALPGYGDWLRERELARHEEQLLRALRLARAAAVSSAGTVTLCPSADAAACGGAWDKGLMVFRDGNGNRLIDEGEDLLLHLPPYPKHLRLRYRAFPNTQYLQYDALGASNRNGSFTLCAADGDARHARQLVISRSGRARRAWDLDGDGFREDAGGQALDCG